MDVTKLGKSRILRKYKGSSDVNNAMVIPRRIFSNREFLLFLSPNVRVMIHKHPVGQKRFRPTDRPLYRIPTRDCTRARALASADCLRRLCLLNSRANGSCLRNSVRSERRTIECTLHDSQARDTEETEHPENVSRPILRIADQLDRINDD